MRLMFSVLQNILVGCLSSFLPISEGVIVGEAEVGGNPADD